MPITIKNKTRRMQVFNLPHDVACSEAACSCTRQVVGVQELDPRTGEKSVRALKRRLADSITLTAAGTEGDTLTGLPHGAAHVPEIKAARVRGEIEITLTAMPAQPAPSAPPAPIATPKKLEPAAVPAAVKE